MTNIPFVVGAGLLLFEKIFGVGVGCEFSCPNIFVGFATSAVVWPHGFEEALTEVGVELKREFVVGGCDFAEVCPKLNRLVVGAGIDPKLEPVLAGWWKRFVVGAGIDPKLWVVLAGCGA